MKKLPTSLVLGSVLAASMMSSTAFAEVTANVALTSDYVFRGVSQSAEQPAIQGGFDYSHDSGLYVGTWASSVDSTFYGGSEMELDFYAGYSAAINDAITYDVGVLRYMYPDNSSSADYDEAYLGLSYSMFSLTYYKGLGLGGKSMALGNADLGNYLDLSAELSLPEDISMTLHVGQLDAHGGSTADYTDYKIGVSKEFSGYGVDLSYTDTNADTATYTINGNDLGAGRLVITLSKSL
jgi:uncharacterized protein (TIGR02001 family)